MGQYYKAILLDKKKKKVIGHVEPHAYDNGAKLMEHSWIGNNFVAAVESLLLDTPHPLAWGGDYADSEPSKKASEHNLYSLSGGRSELKPEHTVDSDTVPFILNHDKKLFIDKRKGVDDNGMIIHPLPLMTAEGNGRGGGDYRGESEIVGQWARDMISVSKEVPEEFTEFIFDLTE